jgi:hypothetical protein
MPQQEPVREGFTKEVDPVNHKETRGETYTDRYTFGEVHFEFDPDKVFADNAHARIVAKDAVRYQYDDKPAVINTPDSVHTLEGTPRKDAEKQAYFALSYLESAGYVTGWKKVS